MGFLWFAPWKIRKCFVQLHKIPTFIVPKDKFSGQPAGQFCGSLNFVNHTVAIKEKGYLLETKYICQLPAVKWRGAWETLSAGEKPVKGYSQKCHGWLCSCSSRGRQSNFQLVTFHVSRSTLQPYNTFVYQKKKNQPKNQRDPERPGNDQRRTCILVVEATASAVMTLSPQTKLEWKWCFESFELGFNFCSPRTMRSIPQSLWSLHVFLKLKIRVLIWKKPDIWKQFQILFFLLLFALSYQTNFEAANVAWSDQHPAFH